MAVVPPPGGGAEADTRALVFDSWFDPYVGAIMLVRIAEGVLRPGQRIRMMAMGAVEGFAVTKSLLLEGSSQTGTEDDRVVGRVGLADPALSGHVGVRLAQGDGLDTGRAGP